MSCVARFRVPFSGIVVCLGLLLLLVSAAVADAQTVSSQRNTVFPAATLRGAVGSLNSQHLGGAPALTGLRVPLDPQRGPLVAPQAPTAPTWSGLGSGLLGSVYSIAVSGSNVYVGGTFQSVCGNVDCSAGNSLVNHIALWNGSTWSALSFGVNADVDSLLVIGNDLYVGGAFTEICGNATCDSGNTAVNHFIKWNGTTWSAVGNGVNGIISAMAANGSDIIIGGVFTEACGNAACNSGNTIVNRIAKWNGTTISALADGVNNPVYAVAANGSDLYAAGPFQMACGNPACNSGNTAVNYIAKWNGTGWSPVHFGFGDPVASLAMDGSDLYAGGYFSYLCEDSFCSATTPAYHIAKWNGSSWSTLGFGLNNVAEGIFINGTNLYAGGDFDFLCGNVTCDGGNTAVHYLAVWNGTTWSPVDNGVDYIVTSIAGTPNGIVVGGYFAAVCGNVTCDANNLYVNQIAEYAECAAPAKPTLTAPTNHATTGKTRVKLKWSAAQCAATYNVTVKKTPGGKVDSVAGRTQTQYKTKPLAKGNYKWFVQACNDLGCTKSKTFKFTIQ